MSKIQFNRIIVMKLFTVLLLSTLFLSNEAMAHCPAPTNLNVTITGNDADLTWDPAPGVSFYEAGYFNQDDGSSQSVIVGGTSYTFTNLTPGTYQFWVRSICDDGSESPPIIIMEEIDGIIIMEELDGALHNLFNCLCDEIYSETTETGNGVAGTWTIAEPPCKTQYNFKTKFTTDDGRRLNSNFKFSQKSERSTGEINNCEGENFPLVDLEDTKTYNAYDTDGKILYKVKFNGDGFEIEWNENEISSYEFDLSDCVICPQEGNVAQRSISLESSSPITVDTRPNPFVNDLRINWSQDTRSSITVNVYNTAAQLMAEPIQGIQYEKGQHSCSLNTESWPVGLYIIVLQTDTSIKEYKVIKMK